MRPSFFQILPTQANSAGDEAVGVAELFNSAEVRRAEIPSANGHACARALAMIAATIVGGGQANPQSARLLSAEAVARALGNPTKAFMFGTTGNPSVPKSMQFRGIPFWFTSGGWARFREPKGGVGRDGYVGWMGLGGSVLQWHEEESIGFGYAMNMMEVTPTNERARVLQQAVQECARHVKKDASGTGGRSNTTSKM